MKRMIKLYRFFKPIAVYTAYLYTFVTILYLCVYELSGRRFLFTPELLWGLFLFSLGSIGLQRLVFGPKRAARIWYPVRLFLYLGAAFLWGIFCLRVTDAAALLVLLPGVFGCLSLEVFNRYRAHMYNTLLQQYKKRKQVCSTKSE